MNPDEENRNNFDEEAHSSDALHSSPEIGDPGDDATPETAENAPEPTPEEPKKAFTISVEEVATVDEPEAPAPVAEPSLNDEPTAENLDIPVTPAPENNEPAPENTSETPKLEPIEDLKPLDVAPLSAPEPLKDRKTLKPAARTNLVATLLIVMVTVLVTAVVVFAILMITQGRGSENQVSSTPSKVKGVAHSSLACEKDVTDVEVLKAAAEAMSLNVSLDATFADGELEDFDYRAIYTYGDSAIAKRAKQTLNVAYADQLFDLYGNTELDPFETAYSQTNEKVTVSHFADAAALTADNAKLVDYPLSDGELVLDTSSLKAALESAGYSCTKKSAE